MLARKIECLRKEKAIESFKRGKLDTKRRKNCKRHCLAARKRSEDKKLKTTSASEKELNERELVLQTERLRNRTQRKLNAKLSQPSATSCS